MGRREASTTHCGMPCKGKTQTNTPSLSTLKRAFGFPTDTNAERQTASVYCAEINSNNVGIFSLPLSVMSVTMQNSGTTGTNGPLGSLLNSISVASVCDPILFCPHIWSWDAKARQLLGVLYLYYGRCISQLPRVRVTIAPACQWCPIW